MKSEFNGEIFATKNLFELNENLLEWEWVQKNIFLVSGATPLNEILKQRAVLIRDR